MSPPADSLYTVRTDNATHRDRGDLPLQLVTSIHYFLIGCRLWLCLKAEDNLLSLGSSIKIIMIKLGVLFYNDRLDFSLGASLIATLRSTYLIMPTNH